eukprot:TRINITY_DN17314_c0_g1_i1.p1 TRINITY_DN17314_c0_g1~~TRINITY_DN17314_c0_g1_i1.p1  ORF type:complete len:288 (+),score=68.36 TRINITY_DN17314_c0_g1_i1:41-865(+)
MGRGANPYLSRKENKERKSKLNLQRSRKLRSKVAGDAKVKENNMQKQVIPHNKAIMMARVQYLRQKLREERGQDPKKEKRKRDEEEDDNDEPEPEPTSTTTTTPATEENRIKRPKIKQFEGERWIVVSPGVVVRKEKELDSEAVGRLDHNTILDVVEQVGRRGRISQPLAGWVSINASDGASICQRDYGSDDDADLDFSVNDSDSNDNSNNDADEDADDDVDSISIDDVNPDSGSDEDPFASLPVQRNRSEAKKIKKAQQKSTRKPKRAKKGRS